MRRYGKQFWRSVPFIRLLVPLTAGIIWGRYLQLPFLLLGIITIACIISLIILIRLSSKFKYRLRWLNGISFNFIFVCIGYVLIHFQNIKNDPLWIGHHLSNANYVSVSLLEPVTEKANSYKALVKTESVCIGQAWHPVKGNIILYFKKDSMLPVLPYGSQIIIQKKLQPVTNTGNPGGFDYKQYCAFQDIHYQLYLQPGDYIVTGEVRKNVLAELLINTRHHVLSVIRKWVPGETEAGVAEALLIGYRDDLDKELVRSYSNAGVVHIIAISGLHLGMIYGVMLVLLKPFRKQKWMRWVKPLLILLVLWGFSLLAGAAASILRSVVMFSFIVIGESLGRRTNIYNTLAASAFCLLLYDPYFLWDVGFQLSYTAVLSIVLFMKPIYQWLYFKNKILNAIWKLNAITISAQVLTLPVVLYYFHQFPNFFLFTNFVAVPLSGFILYGELLLLVVCKISFFTIYTGKLISFLIGHMNRFIEHMDRLPFSVTDNVQVSLLQTIVLFIATGCIAWWLLEKKKRGLLIGLSFLLVFFGERAFRMIRQSGQQKLVVYNIPKQTAIDIIEGNTYRFLGDSSLAGIQSFQLKPSRMLLGVKKEADLSKTRFTNHLITGRSKSVLMINKRFEFAPVSSRIPIDIIILSNNPGVYMSQLAAIFDCRQYIFDSSNPLWKIQFWKKDADSLHLRHHTISEQGAFEMDL